MPARAVTTFVTSMQHRAALEERRVIVLHQCCSIFQALSVHTLTKSSLS
jgi:hypothetical protein